MLHLSMMNGEDHRGTEVGSGIYIKERTLRVCGVTVQEIAERFIEGEPKLRKAAVHQEHLDRKDDTGKMSGDDKIGSEPTADKSQKDGTVYFGIRFTALLPSDGEEISMRRKRTMT